MRRARWGAVHPGYVARFGPEAATIGPPASPRATRGRRVHATNSTLAGQL